MKSLKVFLLRTWIVIVTTAYRTYYRVLFNYYRKRRGEIHRLEMRLILNTTPNIGYLLRSNKLTHRKFKVAQGWALGYPIERIARENNLTQERVRQLVWKTYHDHRNGLNIEQARKAH